MAGYENKELDENTELEVEVGENNEFKVDVGENKELKEYLEIEVVVGENKENKEIEVVVEEETKELKVELENKELKKENIFLEVEVRENKENKELKEKKQGFIAKVIEFIAQCSLYLPIGRWLLFIAGCPWCVFAHWLQNKDVVEEVRENKKLEDVVEEVRENKKLEDVVEEETKELKELDLENKELKELDLENKELKKENIFLEVEVRENKELLRKMGLRFLWYYNADADDNGNEIKFLNKCAVCILVNLIILYFFIEFNAYELVLSPSMCGGIFGIAFFFAIVMFFDDPDVLIKALCKAVSVTLPDDQLVAFKRNTKGHRNFYINYTIIISILFGVFCTYLSDWIINVKVVLDCHKINPDSSTGIPCQLEDLIYDGYCCNAVELDGDMGAFFAVIGGIITSIKGVVYLLASNTIGIVREPGAKSSFERVRKKTMNSAKEFANSPRFSRSSRSISREVANSPSF